MSQKKCDRCGTKVGWSHAPIGDRKFWANKVLCADCSRAISLGEMSPKKPGFVDRVESAAEAAAKERQTNPMLASPAERLRDLERLRDDGLVSPAEYDSKRTEILREL